MFIGVASWGTYTTAFCDVRLAGEEDRCRTLIGDVSGLYRCDLGLGDPLYVRRVAALMASAAQNMLVL